MNYQEKPFSPTESSVEFSIQRLIETAVTKPLLEQKIEPGFRERMLITFTDKDELDLILQHSKTFKEMIKQKIETKLPGKLPLIELKFNEQRNLVLEIKADIFPWRFKREVKLDDSF